MSNSLNFPLSSLHKHIIKVWALERAGARDLCVIYREGARNLCVIERVGARDLCFMERADPGDLCCEGLSTVKWPQQHVLAGCCRFDSLSGQCKPNSTGSFRKETGVTEEHVS
jgi:hypothetical protein